MAKEYILYSVRVISRKRLVSYWRKDARAEAPLRHWFQVTTAAHWTSLNEVRRTFRHADRVRVRSGNSVTVFNVGGNNYRLIAAIHYNTQTVFVLRVLSHAEYDHEAWKEEL